MADIGGYPVHNYGTDPLGRMGVEMFKSSLDWDEKQKELERQSQMSVLKSERDAKLKLAESGDLPVGGASGFFTPGTSQGLDVMSGRKRQDSEMQSSKLRTENVKLKVELDAREDTLDEDHLKKWEKKRNIADLAGDEEGRQIANDNIKFRLDRMAQRTGLRPLSVDEYVNQNLYKDWHEEGLVKKVAKATDALTNGVAQLGEGKIKLTDLAPLLEEARTEISLTERRPEFGKDSLALYKKQVEDAIATVGKITTEANKSKEPSTVPIGTIHTVDNPDGTKSQVRFEGIQNGQQVWTNVGRGPGEKPDKGTTNFRDLIEVNKGRVASGQKPYTMEEYLTTVVHRPTVTPEQKADAKVEGVKKTLQVLTDQAYPTPEDYQKAVKSGKMSVNQAAENLKRRWPDRFK